MICIINMLNIIYDKFADKIWYILKLLTKYDKFAHKNNKFEIVDKIW